MARRPENVPCMDGGLKGPSAGAPSHRVPTVGCMDVWGWLEAWPGIVSLGWFLAVIVMLSFAAGAVSVTWWKDRPWRREQSRDRREHHRQYLARKQREKEREAGDRRLFEDVAWQWPDVLAQLRSTGGDSQWLDLRGTRPVRVTGGVTLVVQPDPERLRGQPLSGPTMTLRAVTLSRVVDTVTGHRLDVEWETPAGAA